MIQEGILFYRTQRNGNPFTRLRRAQDQVPKPAGRHPRLRDLKRPGRSAPRQVTFAFVDFTPGTSITPTTGSYRARLATQLTRSPIRPQA